MQTLLFILTFLVAANAAYHARIKKIPLSRIYKDIKFISTVSLALALVSLNYYLNQLQSIENKKFEEELINTQQTNNELGLTLSNANEKINSTQQDLLKMVMDSQEMIPTVELHLKFNDASYFYQRLSELDLNNASELEKQNALLRTMFLPKGYLRWGRLTLTIQGFNNVSQYYFNSPNIENRPVFEFTTGNSHHYCYFRPEKDFTIVGFTVYPQYFISSDGTESRQMIPKLTSANFFNYGKKTDIETKTLKSGGQVGHFSFSVAPPYNQDDFDDFGRLLKEHLNSVEFSWHSYPSITGKFRLTGRYYFRNFDTKYNPISFDIFSSEPEIIWLE